MKDAIEIIWHGRGGQGAFSAAKLTACAYASSSRKHFALAFPSFGPERRGAPVFAYDRLARRAIGDRSVVQHADYIICLDQKLMDTLSTATLKAGGKLLCATDAICALATEILGRALVNTAMAALLTTQCDELNEKDIIEGIRLTLPKPIQEKNIALVHASLEKASSLLGDALYQVEGTPPCPQQTQRPRRENVAGGFVEYMNLKSADIFAAGTQQSYSPGKNKDKKRGDEAK